MGSAALAAAVALITQIRGHNSPKTINEILDKNIKYKKRKRGEGGGWREGKRTFRRRRRKDKRKREKKKGSNSKANKNNNTNKCKNKTNHCHFQLLRPFTEASLEKANSSTGEDTERSLRRRKKEEEREEEDEEDGEEAGKVAIQSRRQRNANSGETTGAEGVWGDCPYWLADEIETRVTDRSAARTGFTGPG